MECRSRLDNICPGLVSGGHVRPSHGITPSARRGRSYGSPAEKPSPPYSQGREARSEGWERICLHAARSLCTH